MALPCKRSGTQHLSPPLSSKPVGHNHLQTQNQMDQGGHALDKPHVYQQACLQVELAWDGCSPASHHGSVC